MSKSVKYIVLTFALMLIFCSCADKMEFYGGELLDSAKISEIASFVFATETAENVLSEKETENLTETKEQDAEYNEDATYIDEDSEKDQTVFWTKSGKVWHLSRDCGYIKNSEVESGSLSDAVESKKERVCSSCGK